MAIDNKEIGRRLKLAREAVRMTQDAVATKLNISRPTVSQIESGDRTVSSLELDRLAYLFGRDIRDFLVEKFDERKDALTALFRANPDIVQDDVIDHLRICLALAREQCFLESLLEIDQRRPIAEYHISSPTKKWDAIKQGRKVADDERSRLGIGMLPIDDLGEILENEGILCRLAILQDDVSGFTMNDPAVGPLIVINKNHTQERQRYSLAHEYAHVLMDRDAIGTVSRESERAKLQEVRANSFAANLLMPEIGILQFLSGIGKDRVARTHAEIFDESGIVPVEIRTAANQKITLYDVALLAHHFGVSRLAALYRFKNMKIITENEFANLKEQEVREGCVFGRLVKMHGYPERKATIDSNARLVTLCMEAYSRDEISSGKFKELLRLAFLSEDQIDELEQHIQMSMERGDC